MIGNLKSRRKIVFGVVITLFVGLLLYDLIVFEGITQREVTRVAGSAARSEFVGEARCVDSVFNTDTMELTCELALEISATQPAVEIDHVVWRKATAVDGSAEWIHFFEDDLTQMEGPEKDGQRYSLVQISKILGFLEQTGAKAALYPFDSHSVAIPLIGCVRRGDDMGDYPACGSQVKNLGIKKFTIDKPGNFALAQVVLTEDEHVKVTLKRPFFIRLISSAFFVLALVFFVHLVRLSDLTELLPKALGYFGALWGIRSVLVPKSVTIFPTLVDYVVLTIFFFLFALIIYDIGPKKEP